MMTFAVSNARSNARAHMMRALFVLCFAGSLAAADSAQSQTTTATKSNPAQPWAYGCQQSQDKTRQLCRIVQNLTVTRGEKQQRLLTVIIRPQPNAKNHAMVLALPHGLFLPNGVELKVDDKKPIKLAIQTSDPKGAYAGGAISDEFLVAMKKGGKMNVTFMSVARKPVTVPVSLTGFTASYNKLKAN